MSMRVTEADNYFEKRNSIAYEYISFFEKLGYIIILASNNTNNIEQYFKIKIDLVVLTGGNNVNPNLYNNNNNNKDKLNDVYMERDNLEIDMIDIAINKNIPIFGICKGFHLLNIYFKGQLSLNISNHVNKNHFLKSDSEILNNKETNSFHNQAILINDLSPDLNVLAITNDKIVEAFIDNSRKILGIQWHPERQDKEFDKELINKFLEGKI